MIPIIIMGIILVLITWIILNGAVHVVGYGESFTSITLDPINVLDDQSITEAGHDITIPTKTSHLGGVLAMGADLDEARVDTPSLRESALFNIAEIITGALPGTLPRFEDRLDNPLPLEENEEMQGLARNAAVGANIVRLFAWLTDGPVGKESGPIFTVRFQSATALVAEVWTNVNLVPDQALRAGRYKVVGAKFVSATGIVGRLIFTGQGERPGAPCVAIENESSLERFRHGNMGIWGEFEHNMIPSAEFVASGADATQIVYLDLIKL